MAAVDGSQRGAGGSKMRRFVRTFEPTRGTLGERVRERREARFQGGPQVAATRMVLDIPTPSVVPFAERDAVLAHLRARYSA